MVSDQWYQKTPASVGIVALKSKIHNYREKRKESERLNRDSFVPWIELKKVHADRKNDKSKKKIQILLSLKIMLFYIFNQFSGKKFV